jgi:hypothetical protein
MTGLQKYFCNWKTGLCRLMLQAFLFLAMFVQAVDGAKLIKQGRKRLLAFCTYCLYNCAPF